MTKIQENQERLKPNGTHLLLVCANVVNLLVENLNTLKKNRGTLCYARKEIGPEINAAKSDHVLSIKCRTKQKKKE
jgi:hypothetical protein